jgi:hypothetical protein
VTSVHADDAAPAIRNVGQPGERRRIRLDDRDPSGERRSPSEAKGRRRPRVLAVVSLSLFFFFFFFFSATARVQRVGEVSLEGGAAALAAPVAVGGLVGEAIDGDRSLAGRGEEGEGDEALAVEHADLGEGAGDASALVHLVEGEVDAQEAGLEEALDVAKSSPGFLTLDLYPFSKSLGMMT